MASAGNNTFVEYITPPRDHFYMGPIKYDLEIEGANVLVYNVLNNEIVYTTISNTPISSQNLQQVTAVGATTLITSNFNNPTTGLTTESNVIIGSNLICPYVNTQIFPLSTGTTQSFPCFSSQWNNYDVTVNIINSSSTLVTMNCTYNGVNQSVWNYTTSTLLENGVTTTRVNGDLTGVPLCKTLGISDHPYDIVTFTVYNPFLNQKTYVKSTNATYVPDGNVIINGYCINPPVETFNQLTLTFSQVILGGTVTVRGFN